MIRLTNLPVLSKNSQKPGNELIDRFQQSFPSLTTRHTDRPDPTQFLSRDDIQLPQRYEIVPPSCELDTERRSELVDIIESACVFIGCGRFNTRDTETPGFLPT